MEFVVIGIRFDESLCHLSALLTVLCLCTVMSDDLMSDRRWVMDGYWAVMSTQFCLVCRWQCDNVSIGDNAASRVSTWQSDCWKALVAKMTAERSFSGEHPRRLRILDVEKCSSTHWYRANVLKTYSVPWSWLKAACGWNLSIHRQRCSGTEAVEKKNGLKIQIGRCIAIKRLLSVPWID